MPVETYLTGNQAAGSVRLMGSIPMHTVFIRGRLQGQTKVHKGVLTDTGHYGRLVMDKGSAWPAFALFAYPSGTSFFYAVKIITTGDIPGKRQDMLIISIRQTADNTMFKAGAAAGFACDGNDTFPGKGRPLYVYGRPG